MAAFGYQFEPPPDGYDNWDDYWRAVAVSEDELGLGADRIVDRAGRGLWIRFRVVPEKKTPRTGCTSTSQSAAGEPIRSRPGAGSSAPRRSG